MKLTKFLAIGAIFLTAACSSGENPDGLFNGSGSGGPGTGVNGYNGPLDVNSIEYFSQVIGDRVYFEVDQSTLTMAATETLNQQATWLLQHGNLAIRVEGHADEQGTREYNIALSARRASAVRNYMVTRGIPDARLTTAPFGKERPVEVCSEERCWSQNRRAVTVVTGGLGV